MKTLIVVCLLVPMMSIGALAQSPLTVGNSQLNIGVGLSEWGIPIYGGIDYCVEKDITLGAELSFRSYNERNNNWKKKDYYRSTIIGISGNFNYHFNSALKISRKYDLYAGLNLGFYTWSTPDGYEGDHTSGIGLGVQIGARYYFSNKVGINLELGTGNAFSGGKFGLSIKL